jgi:NAD(P) transhydrogenase
MDQARVAMRHAFDPGQRTAVSSVLPTGIYTIPEASMVGDTEASLQKQGVAYCVGRASYEQNARGEIIGDETGFLKLLFRLPDRKLLGVHVLGEQASEVVHIGLMVMLADGVPMLLDRAVFQLSDARQPYKTATEDAASKRGSPPRCERRHSSNPGAGGARMNPTRSCRFREPSPSLAGRSDGS